MRYTVIGDRNFTNYQAISKMLKDAFSGPGDPPDLLISGPHPGVEALACIYAENNELPVHLCNESSLREQMRELLRDSHILVIISEDLDLFSMIKEFALSREKMVIEFPISQYMDYYDL